MFALMTTVRRRQQVGVIRGVARTLDPIYDVLLGGGDEQLSETTADGVYMDGERRFAKWKHSECTKVADPDVEFDAQGRQMAVVRELERKPMERKTRI